MGDHKMLPRDIFLKATNAATIAMAAGFEETSVAFQEIALASYREMTTTERRALTLGEKPKLQNPTDCGAERGQFFAV